MNRIIRILLVAIMALSLGVFFYTGYNYYLLKKEDGAIRKEIKDIARTIEETDTEIEQLQKDIDTISSENSDAFKEYRNWQRHDQKLSEILASE